MEPQTSVRALAGYVAGWGAIAGVVAILGLLAVRAIAPAHIRDPIAAVRDRCVVRHTAAPQRPPVSGRPAASAHTGVYASSPPVVRLIGALRRGLVVVQYRPRLPRSQVDRLRRVFGDGTPRRIVTPDATAMPYAVAGTAWDHLIGCRRLDGGVLRALERFAHSYAGHGPDSRP